jgi:hypothetical protein
MKRKLCLVAASLVLLAMPIRPVRADPPGCKAKDSTCSLGSECCSHSCSQGADGYFYCD